MFWYNHPTPSRGVAAPRAASIYYPMTSLSRHPEAKIVRLQLRQNLVLRHMACEPWDELEPLLDITDYAKGALLENQGDSAMQQYFILDGILKRVVSNPAGVGLLFDVECVPAARTPYQGARVSIRSQFQVRLQSCGRATSPSPPPAGERRSGTRWG